MKQSYLTIPNLLTLLRFIFSFVFVYLIIKHQITLAIIILVIAILSDILDGFLARKLKTKSKFGEAFDLFSDGTLIGLSLAVLTYYKYIEILITLFAIASGLILCLSYLIYRKVEVKYSKYLGKATGWFYFVLIIFALIYPQGYDLIKWPTVIYSYIIYSLVLYWNVASS